MAKQEKVSTRVAKLGRSAVTGKFVLAPASKGKVSAEKTREVTRNVLAQRKA